MELPLAQPTREVSPDPPQMSPRRPAQLPAPLLPQTGEGGARVLWVGPTFEEPSRDQAIDEPRDTARGKHDPFGELAHAQRPVRRPGEAQEDVVLGELEAVRVAQLPIERADHPIVRVQE